jgi:hypothetical protein
MAKYKTISVSEQTFEEFERLAKKYKLTNKGLLEATVKYFKVSNADPRDPSERTQTEEIKALTKVIKEESNSIKAFIKQQERVTLNPIKEILLEFNNTTDKMGVMRRRQGIRLLNYLEDIFAHFQIKKNYANKDE